MHKGPFVGHSAVPSTPDVGSTPGSSEAISTSSWWVPDHYRTASPWLRRLTFACLSLETRRRGAQRTLRGLG